MKRLIWILPAIALVVFAAYLLRKNLFNSKDIDLPLTAAHAGLDGMASYFEVYERLARVPGNQYADDAKLELLMQRGVPSKPGERAKWEADAARTWLNIGEQKNSYAHFEEFERLIKEYPDILSDKEIDPRYADFIRSIHAIAHMRQGEIDNCLNRHNDESCIFPIKGGGVHSAPEGAAQARKLLLELLQEDPDNVENIWVLNLVCMALGNYPEGVPAQYLIDPNMFESDTNIARFTDVAHQAGVAFNSLSGGVCMEDFDNDGYLDIVTSGWQLYERVAYFHNNGDGTFSNWSGKSGLAKVTGGLNMVHADYNADGWKDILVLRGGWWDNYGCMPNSLLRNNGDGTFEDVTWEAGLHGRHPSQNARFEDFNNDGLLDLFIGNESTKGSPDHPCELYINNGDGTFTDQAKAAGVDIKAYVKGSASADFDGDGDIDLYLSNSLSANIFLKNMLVETGKFGFEDITKQTGTQGPKNSFPTWFFDYDNDGDSDLFVATFERYLEPYADFFVNNNTDMEFSALYRNNGDGTFTDVAGEMGLHVPVIGMGSNFGDFDSDGWLDMYIGTGFPDYRALIPNLMFRHNGKVFQDVTTAGGFGHLQKGHGIAFGDVDLDGDNDIYAVMGGALQGDYFWNVLYENPGNDNDYLKIDLQGVNVNIDAIGARVKAIVTDSTGSSRNIFRTLNTGGSFGSSPLTMFIGLGENVKHVDLEIYWSGLPAGGVQVFRDVPFNCNLKITEGEEEPAVIDSKQTFTFSHVHKSHM